MHAITHYTLHIPYTCGWWDQAVMEADHSLLAAAPGDLSRLKKAERQRERPLTLTPAWPLRRGCEIIRL